MGHDEAVLASIEPVEGLTDVPVVGVKEVQCANHSAIEVEGVLRGLVLQLDELLVRRCTARDGFSRSSQ